MQAVLPVPQWFQLLPLSGTQAVPCSCSGLRQEKKNPGHTRPRGNARNKGQVRFLLPLPKAALAWESQGQGTARSPAGMTAGWGGGSGGWFILPGEHRSRHRRARRCLCSGRRLPGDLVLPPPFGLLPAVARKSGILGLTSGRLGFICRLGQQAVGTTQIQPIPRYPPDQQGSAPWDEPPPQPNQSFATP